MKTWDKKHTNSALVKHKIYYDLQLPNIQGLFLTMKWMSAFSAVYFDMKAFWYAFMVFHPIQVSCTNEFQALTIGPKLFKDIEISYATQCYVEFSLGNTGFLPFRYTKKYLLHGI